MQCAESFWWPYCSAQALLVEDIKRSTCSCLLKAHFLLSTAPLIMAWGELTAGRWVRSISENESFLKMLGDSGHALGREHWAVSATASFTPQGSLAQENLSSLVLQSWKNLRFNHPSIAAYPTDGETFAYDVPDVAALDEWSSSTFQIVDDGTTDELIASFKPGPYATLAYFPKSNELLLHTAHWRTDGIGALLLLDAIFHLMADPSLPEPTTLLWGQETARLAPPVEQAANMPTKPSDADKTLAQQCVEPFHTVTGSVGITYQGTIETAPASTRTAYLHLSAAETDAVVHACKARGHPITVTAAVHASIAAANYAHAAPADQGKHYTSTIKFNLRPYLPEPYSGRAYAGAVYTTGWMKAVTASSTWDERAQAYSHDYRAGLTPAYISAHREYARGLSDLLRNMPQGGDPPSDVDISSLGVVDEKLVHREQGAAARGIQVDNVSVGVEVLTRQCVCFLWTFRERLSLSVVYNESFYTLEMVAAFLHTVEVVLFQELGI